MSKQKQQTTPDIAEILKIKRKEKGKTHKKYQLERMLTLLRQSESAGGIGLREQ